MADQVSKSLKEKLERLGKAIAENEKKLPPKVVEFPLWKNDERVAPASILRSALFGVVKRGKRRRVENKVIISW
jgi:hypothetical protein